MSLLLAAVLLAGPRPEALASRFLSALAARDLVAIRAMAGADPNLSSDDWRSVREVVEKYDCIEIDSVEVDLEDGDQQQATLRVAFRGRAVTVGSPRRSVALPPVWFLRCERTDDRWQLRWAMTAEKRLAIDLAAQQTDAQRDALLHLVPVDLRAMPRELATEATDRVTPTSEDALRYALALSRANGDREAEVFVLHRGSGLAVVNHDFARAATLARSSLEVAKKSGSPDALAIALFTVGISEWFSEDWTTGVDTLEQCGALADQLDDPRTAIKAIYMAAYILQRQGNLTAAVGDAERSAALSRQVGWRPGRADALLLNASLYEQLQKPEMYADLSRRAFAEATALGDKATSRLALYNIADAEGSLGHLDSAVKAFEQVISIGGDDSFVAAAYDQLGFYLFQEGHLDRASNALAKAVEFAGSADDRRLMQSALAHWSDVLRAMRQTELALALAREAIAVQGLSDGATRSDATFVPWAGRLAEGRALADLCRIPEAIAAFRETVAMIETNRLSESVSEETRSHYFDRYGDAYAELARLLVDEGDSEGAIEVSEQIKGRVLQDVVEGGRVDLTSLMTAGERLRERELNQTIAAVNVRKLAAPPEARPALDRELAQARNDLQGFVERIYLLRTRPPIASPRRFSEMTAAVPDNAIVLDYVVTETSVLLFVLRNHRVVLTDVLPLRRADLLRRVNGLATALQRRDLRWSSEASALYRILLQPVERILTPGATICIVPDGDLWRLPFHALPARNGRPLLERSPVFYSPSLAFLGQVSGRGAGRGESLLAFGNPTIGPRRNVSTGSTQAGGLSPLHDAEREVQSIGRLYKRPEIFVGSAARESTVKRLAGRYDVLHFATHALLDDRAPMFSSLVFAAGDGEDGFLEARELLRLDLHARLAVLSACQTGAGGAHQGEGVIGLSWAFLFAGCPTTVVSRWIVDSASTRELMVQFHRELKERGLSTAEALRRAELTLRSREQYRHPFYWAAFNVVGVGW